MNQKLDEIISLLKEIKELLDGKKPTTTNNTWATTDYYAGQPEYTRTARGGGNGYSYWTSEDQNNKAK